MALSRPIACLCFCIALCAGGLSAGRARGAELPALDAPAVYQGEYNKNDNDYRILLYLGPLRDFVLFEELTLPNGKVSAWETTGRWHQIYEETFLQLTNGSGFYRILNVGGAGNLYVGMHMPTGRQVTVPLRLAKAGPPEYTALGALNVTKDSLFFEDANSGIAHRVAPEKLVQDFLKGEPLEEGVPMTVQIRAMPVKDGEGRPALRIKDIRSIPGGKTWDPQNTPNHFLDAVAGSSWRVTRIGDEEPRSLYVLSFFPEKGKIEGTLEVFDGNRHIEGAYTLRDTRLALAAKVADKALGAVLKKTKSWQLAGEVLELWDENHVVAVLEKARW